MMNAQTKQLINRSFAVGLLISLFTAVNLPSAALANYCAPAPRAASQSFKEIEKIGTAIMTFEKSYNLAQGRSQALLSLQSIRGKIEALIGQLSTSQKIRAKILIHVYIDVLKKVADEAFRQRPHNVYTLRDLNKSYGISVKKTDLMWLFPTAGDLPADTLIYPESATTSRIGLSELNVLFKVFKGLGYQKPIEKSYVETVKCMLSATLAGQLSYTQALRGKMQPEKLSNGTAKVCGQINLQQIYNAFQTSQVKDLVDAHNRKTLLSVLPNSSVFEEKQFKAEMSALNIYDNSGFMVIYIGGTPAGMETPSDEVYTLVSAKVDQAITRATGRFGGIEFLTSFFRSPEFLAEIQNLQGDCNRTDANFIETLRFAENLFFVQAFDQAVYSTSQDISTLSETNFVSIFTEVLTRAKTISMAMALKTTMYLYGMEYETAEDIDLAVDRFTENVIFPKVQQRIASLKKENRLADFFGRVRTAYAAKASGTQPAAKLRLNYNAEMYRAAKKAQTYMTQKAEKLPFKRDIIVSTFNAELANLSQESAGLVELMKSEQDYAKAKSYWQRLVAAINKELSATKVSKRTLLAQEPSWYSLTGLKNMATSSYKYAKSWVSSSQERANKDTARAQKVAAEYKALIRIGSALGFDRFNAEPKTLNDVLPAFYNGKTESEGQSLEKTYRENLVRSTLGEHYTLDLPYQGTKLYKVLAKMPSSAGAGAAVTYSLEKSASLQRTHLARVAAVKKLSDLNDYAKNSAIIPTLLGQGSLDLFTGRKNIWPDTRASFYEGDLLYTETFVIPHLVKFHGNFAEKLIRKDMLTAKLWQDSFTNSTYAFWGLFGAWGTREVITRWFRVPGLTMLASALKSSAYYTRSIVTDYYQKLLGIIFVQVGYDLYNARLSTSQLRKLDNMYFTNSSSSALMDLHKEYSISKPSLWVPMLDDVNYFAQKDAYEQMRRDSRIGAAVGLGVLAIGPLMNYTRMGSFFGNITTGRVLSRQKAMKKAQAAGDTAKVQAIRQDFQNNTSHFFKRRSADHIFEFKALGLPPGTWSVSQLKSALDKIKAQKNPAKTARAEEAYKNLMATIGARYVPAQSSESLRQSFVRSIWKSDDEAVLFAKEYDRLFAVTKKGAK